MTQPAYSPSEVVELAAELGLVIGSPLPVSWGPLTRATRLTSANGVVVLSPAGDHPAARAGAAALAAGMTGARLSQSSRDHVVRVPRRQGMIRVVRSATLRRPSCRVDRGEVFWRLQIGDRPALELEDPFHRCPAEGLCEPALNKEIRLEVEWTDPCAGLLIEGALDVWEYRADELRAELESLLRGVSAAPVAPREQPFAAGELSLRIDRGRRVLEVVHGEDRHTIDFTGARASWKRLLVFVHARVHRPDGGWVLKVTTKERERLRGFVERSAEGVGTKLLETRPPREGARLACVPVVTNLPTTSPPAAAKPASRATSRRKPLRRG